MKTKTIIRALFWGVVLLGLYYLSTHINYVDGHYCFNTIDACYGVNQ
jgi:hypothetical protein